MSSLHHFNKNNSLLAGLMVLFSLVSFYSYSQPGPIHLTLEIFQVVLVDGDQNVPIENYSILDGSNKPFEQDFSPDTNYIKKSYRSSWIIEYKGESIRFRVPDSKKPEVSEYGKAQGEKHRFLEEQRIALSQDFHFYTEYRLIKKPIIIQWNELHPLPDPYSRADQKQSKNEASDRTNKKDSPIPPDVPIPNPPAPVPVPAPPACDSLIYLQVMDHDYNALDQYEVELLIQGQKIDLPFYQSFDSNRIFFIPKEHRCFDQKDSPRLILSKKGFITDTLSLQPDEFRIRAFLYRKGEKKINVNGGIPYHDLGTQFVAWVESPQIETFESLVEKYDLEVIESKEWCRLGDERLVYKKRLKPSANWSASTQDSLLTDFRREQIQIGLAFKTDHFEQVEGINSLYLAALINEQDVYENRDSVMDFLKSNGFENVVSDYFPITIGGNPQRRYFSISATLPLQMSMDELYDFVNLQLAQNDKILGVRLGWIEITCPSSFE